MELSTNALILLFVFQVDAVVRLKDVSEGLQGIKHIKEKVSLCYFTL